VSGRGQVLARATLAVALAGSLAFVAGCGRRATAADCRLIVDKSVELRMKQMSLTDPAAIQKREEQVSSELRAELDACEGRRVTARTMTCVQASKTPQELEQCLR
jgi:hypothetical protein